MCLQTAWLTARRAFCFGHGGPAADVSSGECFLLKSQQANLATRLKTNRAKLCLAGKQFVKSLLLDEVWS